MHALQERKLNSNEADTLRPEDQLHCNQEVLATDVSAPPPRPPPHQKMPVTLSSFSWSHSQLLLRAQPIHLWGRWGGGGMMEGVLAGEGDSGSPSLGVGPHCPGKVSALTCPLSPEEKPANGYTGCTQSDHPQVLRKKDRLSAALDPPVPGVQFTRVKIKIRGSRAPGELSGQARLVRKAGTGGLVSVPRSVVPRRYKRQDPMLQSQSVHNTASKVQ